MFSKSITALAAASLIGLSSAAAAQTAAPTGPASAAVVERAGADAQGTNELRGGMTVYIIGAIVLGLIIWGAIELFDDDDSDSP